VLHTSGALNARVLDPVKACGAAVGSMHPLQSFSGVAVPALEGRVFAVKEIRKRFVRRVKSRVRSADRR